MFSILLFNSDFYTSHPSAGVVFRTLDPLVFRHRTAKTNVLSFAKRGEVQPI